MGKEYHVEMSPTDTVKMLKDKISEIEGSQNTDKRFIFDGKNLSEDQLLSNYNLQDGSTVYMVLNLRKPVIHFYNYHDKEKIKVDIDLDKNVFNFSHIYPQPNYINRERNYLLWDIETSKNQIYGKNSLIDSETKKKYSYLFWEAFVLNDKLNEIFNYCIKNKEFFLFSSEEVLDKLDDLLKRRGLNETERQDFLTYWMSDLTSKKFVIVTFMSNKIYDALVKLTVDPSPAKILRICVLFKSLDHLDNIDIKLENEKESNIRISEDEFPEREEYKDKLVVEWGAINMKP